MWLREPRFRHGGSCGITSKFTTMWLEPEVPEYGVVACHIFCTLALVNRQRGIDGSVWCGR